MRTHLRYGHVSQVNALSGTLVAARTSLRNALWPFRMAM